MGSIRSAPTNGLLRDAVLFDIYRPKVEGTGGLEAGEKSLAVRLTLHNDEATLTDAQIDAAMSAIMAQITQQVAARLRG